MTEKGSKSGPPLPPSHNRPTSSVHREQEAAPPSPKEGTFYNHPPSIQTCEPEHGGGTFVKVSFADELCHTYLSHTISDTYSAFASHRVGTRHHA